MKKRILSLLLCLCMALTLLPASALADDAPHTHCTCGQEAADAHADPYTAHDDTTSWTAWTENDSLPAASGKYYLTQDVTLTQWWEEEVEVALCLNGHKIIGADGAGPIYVVPGAKLSVTDCAGGGQIAVTLELEGDDSSALTVNGGQLGQVGLYGGAMSLAGGQIETLYAMGGSLSLTGGELGALMFTLFLQTTQIEAYENVTITGLPGEDFLPAGTDVAIVIMGTDCAEVTGIADALEAKVAAGGGTLMNGTAPAQRLTQEVGEGEFVEGYVIVYAAPLTIHTHDWAEGWATDQTHHWHDCAADNCAVTDNAHKPGYGEHTKALTSNETQHWEACADCGWEGEKAEHTFGDWTTVLEPTATQKGSKERACSECGYKETEELPATGGGSTGGRHYRVITTVAWPFTDVKTTDACYESVKYVYDKKWMEGTSATTFEPEGQLTRAMLATVLYRIAGSPAVTGTLEFTDTKTDTWYSAAVLWAARTDVLRGYGNGMFGPEDLVSVEMLNMVLGRRKGEDPTWVGDAALARPATRAEIAQALVENTQR